MRGLRFFSPRKIAQARGVFNLMCFVALMFLFYNRVDVLRNPLLRKSSVLNGELVRRRAVEISTNSSLIQNLEEVDPLFCAGVVRHSGFGTQCEYLKAHPECSPGGFFDYLRFFYCDCEKFSLLG